MGQPKTEEAIFCDALELPIEQQAAFIENACEGNTELLASVRALLQLHDTDGEFLATPAIGLATDQVYEQSGDRVGCYELEELIGEGGFGVVWQAQQLEPIQRKVALKIVKLGMDSESIVRRFDDERQTLALMNHPNIATVLDAGVSSNGRPFFAMELVDGESIDKFCDEHGLSVRQRLEIFVTVCRAVQHAHQKGIVHRDLKPSNILVMSTDGSPVPKVIDFGIATAIQDKDNIEESGAQKDSVVGTPAYMSPEQRLNQADIDTRADIYSLGVVLYRLLTGCVPGLNDQAEGSVTPPSQKYQSASGNRQHGLQIDEDLDWITSRAMRNSREDRYQSASEFAMDIERYLEGQAVAAHPGGATYQLKKFARRNRLVVSSAFITFAALLIAFLASTWGYIQANEKRELADSQKNLAVEKQQEAERLKEIAESEARKLRVVARVLKNMLPEANPYRGMNYGFQIRENLDQLIESLDTLSSEPEIEADLRFSVAHIYKNMSKFGWARLQFNGAYEIRRDELGADHPKTLQCLNGVARCELKLGNLKRAEEIVFDLLQRTEEKNPRVNIAARRNLRHIREAQDRHEEALEIAKENVELSKTIFSKEPVRQMDILGEYARSSRYVGHVDEAERAAREALEILERRSPTRKYVIANTKHLLADILIQQKQYDEAKQLMQSFVDMQSATLGENDELVIRGLAKLAEVHRLDDDMLVAEQVALDAIDRSEQLPKDEIGSRATARRQLARVLADINPEEAVDSWEIAIKLRRQRLGDHAVVAEDLLALATVMTKLERFHNASERIKEAIDILEKRNKASQAQLPDAYLQYADVLDALEKPEEAQGYRNKAKEFAQSD